jgi:hypothetical protein
MLNQEGWRWCNKCSALHLPDKSNGQCEGGPQDEHDSTKPDSAKYLLRHESDYNGVNIQKGWRCCKKCRVLYHGPKGENGKCYSGGKHEPLLDGATNKEIKYEMFKRNPPSAPVRPAFQKNWYWCRVCQTLFHQGGEDTGGCPGCASGHHKGETEYLMQVKS